MKKSNKENNNEELLQKQIDELNNNLLILNISEGLLYIFIIATIFNLDFINYSKVKIYDILNNTNDAEKLENAKSEKIQSVQLFIFVTGMFVYISYYNFNNLKNQSDDYNEIYNGWQNFIASILTFVAIDISASNIEF